jgi:uncharacterized membrane protein
MLTGMIIGIGVVFIIYNIDSIIKNIKKFKLNK